MSRDFAKTGGPRTGGRKSAPRTARSRHPAKSRTGGGWRWYGAGVVTGIFASFLVYLATLPPEGGITPDTPTPDAAAAAEASPPKPRFDFYRLLPEESIEVEMDVAPAEVERPMTAPPAELYLLQAGSFRQREDADRRRAELLLLGLEPRIEEATGDNGRWYRVSLGPFETQSAMTRARGLTTNQGIDTLVLKRSRP